MHPWFIYNTLRLAVVSLQRGNFYACSRYLGQVQCDLSHRP